MDATPHVLVAYATASGSTAAVAERVAARLRRFGYVVDSCPAGPGLDPAPFDAIVLGSAVHDMAWLPPAVEVLSRIPRSTPVWFFSIGGVAPTGPVTRRLVALELDRVEGGFPAAFRGREHRLFAGVVRMGGLPLWGRLFWRLIGGRDGDHRDWPAIDAWAQRIGIEVSGLAGRRSAEGRPSPVGRTSATPPDAYAAGSS